MKVELYQEVALTRDLPEHSLKVGDVAMLVDVRRMYKKSRMITGIVNEEFEPIIPLSVCGSDGKILYTKKVR